MSNLEYAVIVDSESEVLEIRRALADVGAQDIELAEFQGLGGSIEDWILVGSSAIFSIRTILWAIYPYVEATRIKSIKVGDIEIVRPRGKDVTKILEMYSENDAGEDITDN